MADRPPLATLAQLVKKVGYTPAGNESTRAEDCLVEASELIRDVAGVTWLNAGGDAVTGVPARIERICIAAAYRGFDNARGLVQRSVGDSSHSWDRSGVEGGSGVYLTDSEEDSIRKASGASGITSVTMVSPYSGDGVEDFDLVTP